MITTAIDAAGHTATAYIYDTGSAHVISIPYINFSLELAHSVPAEEREDEIIVHLFHMMDEAECTEIARKITEATDKQ
ncbi:MAG TPA: hypothetical protein H9891_04920 [Candidatus Salinicoccus stercoripullorum]|uniref:Uncharacterized protein n=1 Tax=Candidatus Salinicoccus stercoripullorum TaxID=2838756 RepID=A0A9D1U070_9STAP|nr:hypothetical protein [Candidatus Salinicoccus stercoripullorum]